VRTDASSKGNYAAHSFVQGKECDGKNNCTDNKPDQWLSVAMLNGDAFEVNHYCLRHGGGSAYWRLRSWELQGREGDSAGWVMLRKHTNDQALADKGFATAGWAVEGGKGSFSQFRVLQTGPNSSGTTFLCCAGLELYGTLLPPTATKPAIAAVDAAAAMKKNAAAVAELSAVLFAAAEGDAAALEGLHTAGTDITLISDYDQVRDSGHSLHHALIAPTATR
jgi:hypothetical protein